DGGRVGQVVEERAPRELELERHEGDRGRDGGRRHRKAKRVPASDLRVSHGYHHHDGEDGYSDEEPDRLHALESRSVVEEERDHERERALRGRNPEEVRTVEGTESEVREACHGREVDTSPVWTAMRNAGATPKETASATESAMRPKRLGGDALRREKIPSNPSNPIAQTMSSIAQSLLPART